jgi:hypothetical protein
MQGLRRCDYCRFLTTWVWRADLAYTIQSLHVNLNCLKVRHGIVNTRFEKS